MVALKKPTELRVCLKCKQAKDPTLDYRKNEPCWCKTCRSAAEKASKSRPAYRAIERERSRERMREKRQEHDHALNRVDRMGGFFVVMECHAQIKTPIEELEHSEYLEEYREEVFPLIPHNACFPFELSNPKE